MIIISGAVQVDPIIFEINKMIDKGAEKAVVKIAEGVAAQARTELSASIAKTGGNETGNLSSAIIVAQTGIGTPGMSRADIVVDTRRAPYALWVEMGRSSPEGLPYSKSGGRDYSKSHFRGHHYMDKALSSYINEGKALLITTEYVMKSLLSKRSMATFGRL